MEEQLTIIVVELLQRYPALNGLQQELLQAYQLLCSCFDAGGKLLVCGNGGSAADSEHLVGELMKGFLLPRPLTQEQRSLFTPFKGGEALAGHLQEALPAVALNTHTALNTAIANDNGAEFIFAQQVWGYGQKNDSLLAMSTSGNAQNIIYALQTAKAKGLTTICITGRAGGTASAYCDVCLRLPATKTFQVQELTLPLYHALCAMLENHYFL